ncbi:MAG: hypothetical protein AB1714_24980 [Acidobacteriota bacterium]
MAVQEDLLSFGERYLKNPAAFPAGVAGEPWGDRCVAILFVGGAYTFSGLNAGQEQSVRQNYEGSLADDKTPGVESRVFKAADSVFMRFDLRGWVLSFDFAHDPEAVRVSAR